MGFSTGRGVVPGSWVQSMGDLEASGWADGWYSILGLSTVLFHVHTSQRHICQYAALWVLIVYLQADTAWLVSLTIDIEPLLDSSQVSYSHCVSVFFNCMQCSSLKASIAVRYFNAASSFQ